MNEEPEKKKVNMDDLDVSTNHDALSSEDVERVQGGLAGLSTDINVIEFQDGDDLILRKRPGRSS